MAIEDVPHPADPGSETFEHNDDVAVLEQIEVDLADVEHALGRLDDGTYGTCTVCGAAIDDERLEALPAAGACVEHHPAAEQTS